MRRELSPEEIREISGQVSAFFGSQDAVSVLLWFFQKTYQPARGMSPEGLQGIFTTQKFLSLKDVENLVLWKMDGQRNALVKELPTLRANGDRVKQVTSQIASAIEAGDKPSALVSKACQLDGIALSIASALLASWSDDYPIIDPRSWRTLSRITRHPYFARFSTTDIDSYDAYVEILRTVAQRLRVKARQLDKALFVLGRSRA